MHWDSNSGFRASGENPRGGTQEIASRQRGELQGDERIAGEFEGDRRVVHEMG